MAATAPERHGRRMVGATRERRTVFEHLTFTSFKSLQRAALPLSPFTLLVGANASGKSNVREAFRFLHGIARGYTLAEIVGEKWIEGGVRVWTGVRGGSTHIAYKDASRFSLRCNLREERRVYDYRIDIELREDRTLYVAREHLWFNGKYVFDTHPEGSARGASAFTLFARVRKYGVGAPPDGAFLDDRPLLAQLQGSTVATDPARRHAKAALELLGSMVFLDLSPDAAREASPIGISTLGDRGENLSSVLASICGEPSRRAQLISWVRALTPLDAQDLTFQQDLNGRVLGILVEGNGVQTPFSSASDGTLRFLAMIAALLNPSRPRFIFFEEIENGIHPNRVFLLLELIAQSALSGHTQIVATSHSPQLLVHAYRSRQARPCLVYRAEDGGSRIVDVRASAGLSGVLNKQDPAALMAAGWLEDAVSFLDDDELLPA
jgi:predicted ATPase